jgi:hypothetical protein
MLRVLPYSSLRLEPRGDLDVAVARLLPLRLALGDRWCPERGFGDQSVLIRSSKCLPLERKMRVRASSDFSGSVP